MRHYLRPFKEEDEIALIAFSKAESKKRIGGATTSYVAWPAYTTNTSGKSGTLCCMLHTIMLIVILKNYVYKFKIEESTKLLFLNLKFFKLLQKPCKWSSKLSWTNYDSPTIRNIMT